MSTPNILAEITDCTLKYLEETDDNKYDMIQKQGRLLFVDNIVEDEPERIVCLGIEDGSNETRFICGADFDGYKLDLRTIKLTEENKININATIIGTQKEAVVEFVFCNEEEDNEQ
ncbi:MAG: hypothetical protein J5525_12535 [Lachnospiraceae bacterium]|nr:hypothetical protein [Lachnospiraceae bacterium]